MTQKSASKIMVVEDEAVISLRLQKILTEMGHNVVAVAYFGEEAVEKARSTRPDLILMDIMIPGELDGIDAAKTLKSELNIPVIFLTAFSEDNIIERAKTAEPFGYILKPVQDRELKAAIEIALYKKGMEKALWESEMRYRALAENSRVGFWQTTLDGYTLYINPAMCEILEIEDPEELRGKSYHSFYDAENLEIVKRNLAKREKGLSSTYEVEITGRKGTRRSVMVSGAPIFYSEGQIHSAIGTFTDITEKKRAEQELIATKNDLERRVKERTAELNDALKTIKQNEKELIERKTELEISNRELLETNQAIWVLARNMDRKKEEMERKVYDLCSGKIMPILKRLQKDAHGKKHQADLELVLNYLNEIVHETPLAHNIGSPLTEQEMRVAMLIKNGLTSRQIAESLSISLLTVETHRKNIRKKLKIDKKNINLLWYLKYMLEPSPGEGQ